ncbi:unnamed protein product [Brassicogethes aeneus]|uniref:Uncharacterized protein n=1 Tax=Brassicogethes aeneus TaxID=1431903 RepID=A0A9P0BJ94_BRAAE|nr:unnamed protein product [Brassicogethes aeneus]
MEDVSSSSILPPNWGTKIIEKKIIEGEDKFPNILLHFVVNCTNQEEFGKWLTEFESLTNASYVISNTDIEDGERIKLKRRLRKNYRGTQEKFKLLHEAPCEITLVVTHNHTTGTADSLRFRKVGDNVREELLNLYQNGHTAGTALEMIKCNIQLACDDYITALADRNKCPSYKYCYDLYMKEFKKKYGPMKFDTEAKELTVIEEGEELSQSRTPQLDEGLLKNKRTEG